MSAALALVGFGLLSVLGSPFAVRSIRRSRALGLLAVPVLSFAGWHYSAPLRR